MQLTTVIDNKPLTTNKYLPNPTTQPHLSPITKFLPPSNPPTNNPINHNKIHLMHPQPKQYHLPPTINFQIVEEQINPIIKINIFER
jgi:hypothetical protein